jgi:hypothetical protein
MLTRTTGRLGGFKNRGRHAGTSNGPDIHRNSGAAWFLPSDNEWYKVAFHKNDAATNNCYAYPRAAMRVLPMAPLSADLTTNIGRS